MKRVTILVDDIGEPDSEQGRPLTFPGESICYIYLPADSVISVEDHVEPLPTEPGARFWARLDADEPQWWFVREVKPLGVFYAPARGTAVSGIHAQRLGLVRLPDPKPTEAETNGGAR